MSLQLELLARSHVLQLLTEQIAVATVCQLQATL